MGPFWRISLSSMVFAFCHFALSQQIENIEILVSIFVLSLFLGYLYEREGNLWAPIGLHAMFNAVTFAVILR